MQYRVDPRSGNQLSVLSFGCMRFPRRVAPIDRTQTEKLILKAIERGINYFDTAYSYPESEAILGEILHKNAVRSKVFVATKLPHQKCKTTEDFDLLFNEQLRRLQTDYVDYYLIHNLSEVSAWQRLCELGIEAWITQKKLEGQIRQIGFSFHGMQPAFLELLDVYDWEFCQIQYNYQDANYQAGRAGLEKAHSLGMPVIVMEPLLGGKLATGLPKETKRLFQAVEKDRSPASWAFRWLWDQPEVTTVLSGMNSDEQLDDNLATAEEAAPGMLSEREAAVFEPVIASLSGSGDIPCTGCNYCMPCPNKVNIPGCFSAYNASRSLGFVTAMPMYITSIGANHPEKNYSGSNCIRCGACEKKCPQHIKIMDSLEVTTKRLEPFWFGALLWGVRKFSS
ncbi:MAG: aldo/keto reductase [Coriobacteriia bacterium]|nr:aldo/keto reductase [Coriobacteriia bacterium]